MNTLNSRTNKPYRFVYQFIDKLNLKNPNKNIALTNLSIYYTWRNIKSEFNFPDGSYSVFDIQDYFEFIIKKHETIADTDNPPVQIDVNKIKIRIVFKIKTGYKLELLTEETMQLLGSSKNVFDKNKNGELVPRLETVDAVLVHCNLVNNNYQQAS